MRTISIVLLLVPLVACSDPVDPEPARVLRLVSDPVDSSNIRTPIHMAVHLLTEDSVPVVGDTVRWSTAEPGAGFGQLVFRGGFRFPDSATIAVVTDSAGEARADGYLGPRVGEQAFRIEAAGADPLELTIQVGPGLVAVGRWELDEDREAQFPSDTMRVHVVRQVFSGSGSPPLLADLGLGEVPDSVDYYIIGPVVLGPGVDPNWFYHLSPQWISVGPWGGETVWECTEPPATEEELPEAPGYGWSAYLCASRLRLVGMEEVPEAYLQRLLDAARGP